jgi:hypothetical protein
MRASTLGLLGLATLALGFGGCAGLLGLDFEPRDDVPAAEAGPPPAAEDAGDAPGSSDAGSAVVDAGRVDAGDGGIDDEQARLAALRVRVADAPTLDGYFTSRSWLYWTPGDGTWRGLRPPSADARQIPHRVIGANDTHAVTGNVVDPATIRVADTSAQVAQFAQDSVRPVAVDDGVLFFSEAVSAAGTIDVLLWKPASPTTRPKIGTVATGAAAVIGKTGSEVFLRDILTVNRLWVASAAAPSVTSVTLTVTPQSATRTDDGVVVTHVAGAETLLRLVTPSVDLTAEIAAADCIIPASERAAVGGGLASYGPWLIFTSRSGILAYRHGDKRLVPVQIRKPTDAFVFNVPHVVRATRLLVFTMPAPQGLHFVPLDAILP